jgi:hypothetical protein
VLLTVRLPSASRMTVVFGTASARTPVTGVPYTSPRAPSPSNGSIVIRCVSIRRGIRGISSRRPCGARAR